MIEEVKAQFYLQHKYRSMSEMSLITKISLTQGSSSLATALVAYPFAKDPKY